MVSAQWGRLRGADGVVLEGISGLTSVHVYCPVVEKALQSHEMGIASIL